MKAITILQPYASLIVAGAKQYETRSWDTPYRGIIAIHAGKNKPFEYGGTRRRGFSASGWRNCRKAPSSQSQTS